MKIKLDFITNSSSTAYVVMIPKNFDIAQAFSELKGKDNSWCYEEELGEEFDDNQVIFLETVVSNIEKLRNGEDLWGDDTEAFGTTQEILLDKKFDVASVDISSDTGGILTGVNMKRIEEIQNEDKA